MLLRKRIQERYAAIQECPNCIATDCSNDSNVNDESNVHDVRNLHAYNFMEVTFDSEFDSESYDSESYDNESYDSESYDSEYFGSDYSDNNSNPHIAPASVQLGTGRKPRMSRNRNGSGNSNSVKLPISIGAATQYNINT